MAEEKYERNYVAIERADDGMYGVTGYFANHEVAWLDDNRHRTRAVAQRHAEFLILEFSMGGPDNPIAIVQLDEKRYVMERDDNDEWQSTDKKVTSRL